MPKFIAEYTPANLDAFTQGYLDCAEWLLNEDDKDKDCNGWSPDAIKQAAADCGDFQSANETLLFSYEDETGRDWACAGHDFWLTRNHHGAGFWDRGSHECLRQLTDAAHTYGECDAYIGDDGLIYLT